MSASQLKPGGYLYIQYAEEDLWHDRLLLARVGTSTTKWVIATPDDDMYIEDFSASCEDISAVRLPAPGGGLPRDAQGAGAYRFRDRPTGRDLETLKREAEVLAQSESLRYGADASDVDGWYAAEEAHGFKKGDKLHVTDESVIAGRKGVYVGRTAMDEEFTLFMEQVSAIDLPTYRKKDQSMEESDARTLAVLRKDGKRQCDFREAVTLLAQVSFEDWRVPGPRTTSWCMQFLGKKNGPMSHHEWWRTVAKLAPSDYGVAEHEMIMRALQDGLEYDQLDLVNLVLCEHLVRRAQLIEYYHRERTRQEMSLGSGGSASKGLIEHEEQDAFMGTAGLTGSLMICPALVEHVSREMERQSSIDKQARKAREERALRRK
mmetsp:Transcript_112135/g.323943  ORF Transcript_112135/g.323943 Transcript_112135/m.323943 type:complete len:376 (+) Transcript_112135:146-1273(+)